MSILLLGASGYIGSAFAAELHRRSLKFEAPPRRWIDYTRRGVLAHYIKTLKPCPELVINAAGFTGKPNVDECEVRKTETVMGNVILPIWIAQACSEMDIPWMHVSSGCIYNGSKEDGGFTENDPPNFCFDQHTPCSFYSGCKAMAEDAIRFFNSQTYVLRLRLPFDEYDGPRNYLSKLQRYPKIYEATNSITHRGDFVKAALDLWQTKAPFGTYNMTNPGWITTRQVVMMMHAILRLDREWEFFKDDEDFYQSGAAMAPRSNCILNVSKLASVGVSMRPVEMALKESFEKWRKE